MLSIQHESLSILLTDDIRSALLDKFDWFAEEQPRIAMVDESVVNSEKECQQVGFDETGQRDSADEDFETY